MAKVDSEKMKIANAVRLGICNALKLKYKDFVGKCKKTEYVDARYICFKILTDLKIRQSHISKEFGKNHSTVAYGIEVYNTRIESKDKKFKQRLDLVAAEMEAICV